MFINMNIYNKEDVSHNISNTEAGHIPKKIVGIIKAHIKKDSL